jgi:hypothetical protein
VPQPRRLSDASDRFGNSDLGGHSAVSHREASYSGQKHTSVHRASTPASRYAGETNVDSCLGSRDEEPSSPGRLLSSGGDRDRISPAVLPTRLLDDLDMPPVVASPPRRPPGGGIVANFKTVGLATSRQPSSPAS